LQDKAPSDSEQNSASDVGSHGSGRWVPRLRVVRRRLAKALKHRVGSSLVRRIILLNMVGLIALLVGFLWLNQTRPSVIEARIQSLRIQGEIIAAALAGTAVVDSNSIIIDPERLLDLQTGETTPDDMGNSIEFSLNPERIAPILRQLVLPTTLRARVYDRDGSLVIDTRSFYAPGDISRAALPPPSSETTLFERTWSSWKRRFGRMDIISSDEGTPGRPPQEVRMALNGVSGALVRVTTAGDTIVYHGFPVQRLRMVSGALQLSTQDGDVDKIIADERLNILMIFGVVLAVMALMSFLMANTIAKPVERLAIAAERVRRSIKSRHQLPDFSERTDEIGHLSAALREMTDALYNRLSATEAFAADVAHELKNPLTSLRSAVETLPRVKNDESRGKLLAVIQHDVKRLDRLISDISDASRLDAELAKGDAEPVDMEKLLAAVVSMSNELRHEGRAETKLIVTPLPRRKGQAYHKSYLVMGYDSRLGQVITNLLENAKTFAPADSIIQVRLVRSGSRILVYVEDEGPGIPEHALERVFERFYTDRPTEHGFGQNSGLGLSISRQIVEAHRGRISVTNRRAPAGRESGGAAFEISLPAADGLS
jgi:two-component system, OmpR family, sensor histidine kinase ChvG